MTARTDHLTNTPTQAARGHQTYVERTDHATSGSTYYAWCIACYWRSPHRKVENAVREFAAAHERKYTP